VRRINGVGPKAAARLEAMGFGTIGEFAHANLHVLETQFGHHHAAWLLDAANAATSARWSPDSEPKSVSRETTFERDLHAQRDRALLAAIFTELCERVARDLARKGYVGRTIGVKLRYDDFRTVTRDVTLDAASPTPPDPPRRRRVPEARAARASVAPAGRARRRPAARARRHLNAVRRIVRLR